MSASPVAATRTSPLPPMSTAAPQTQVASSTHALCQCSGRSTVTTMPGSASKSSVNSPAILLHQFAVVTTDNSTRAPALSSYHVSNGRAPSRETSRLSRSAGVTPAVCPSRLRRHDVGSRVPGVLLHLVRHLEQPQQGDERD